MRAKKGAGVNVLGVFKQANGCDTKDKQLKEKKNCKCIYCFYLIQNRLKQFLCQINLLNFNVALTQCDTE